MDTNLIFLVIAAVVVVHRLGFRLPILAPFLDKIVPPGGSPVKLPPEGEKITGRPVLDMMLRAALKQYQNTPLVGEVLIQFAKQIDEMLDKAGVPELPDLSANGNPEVKDETGNKSA